MMTINYSATGGRTVRTDAQKAAHAERMRAARAKAKADKAMNALESGATADEYKAYLRSELTTAMDVEAAAKAARAGKPETILEKIAKAAEVEVPGIAEPVLEVAPPKSGVCISAKVAQAEAKAAYGDAPYTIKKTARGDWFWGPAEAAVEVAKAPEAAKSKGKPAKAAKSEPKAAKAPKGEKAPKAAKGDKTPRPGTDAEVILRQLTGAEGMTRESIEGELAKLRGKPVKIAPRSTALRFAESYGYRLSERKDGEQDRFFLVRPAH